MEGGHLEWAAALLTTVLIYVSAVRPAALKRLSMGKSLPSAGVWRLESGGVIRSPVATQL